jgi:hypothetical protein
MLKYFGYAFFAGLGWATAEFCFAALTDLINYIIKVLG